MFTCPACSQPGVPIAARFFLYLYEPLKCQACSAALFAHPMQGIVGSVVTLLFVVLALAVLALPMRWLLLVLGLFAIARIGVTVAFPLVVGKRPFANNGKAHGGEL